MAESTGREGMTVSRPKHSGWNVDYVRFELGGNVNRQTVTITGEELTKVNNSR